MTMDRTRVLDLLPCYLCGDLPDHINASIEAYLDTDLDMKGRLDTLKSSRDLCVELLQTDIPAHFDFEAPPAPAPAPAAPNVPATRPVGLVLGIAAAALLFVSMRSVSPSIDSGTEVGELHTEVSSNDALLLTADSPMALMGVLRDHGVSPQLAMVPDMSAMGFTLVGARILAPDTTGGGPGVAVVYERDGERFVCQIQLQPPTHGAPIATDTAKGVVLRAYRTHSGAIVSWYQGGRWCVWGGPAEPMAMLSMVKMRMTRG